MSRIVHFEIPADDPERAIQFYESVFGWRIEKWEGPIEYWLIMTGPEDEPGIDGGLARREDPATTIENFIDTKDLDASLKAVAAQGGEITRPKMAVPGVGWVAYIKDTEGNIIGLMQSDQAAS